MTERDRYQRTPERMSKADLLEAIGRQLRKDELVSLLLAVRAGYRPFVPEGEE